MNYYVYLKLIINVVLLWIYKVNTNLKACCSVVLVDVLLIFNYRNFFTYLLITLKHIEILALTSFVYIKKDRHSGNLSKKHSNILSHSDWVYSFSKALASIKLCQHTFYNKGIKTCLREVVGNNKYCFKHWVDACDDLSLDIPMDSSMCVFLEVKEMKIKLCNKKAITTYCPYHNKFVDFKLDFNLFILSLTSCDYITWNFIQYFYSLSDIFYPLRCSLTRNSGIFMHSFVQNYYSWIWSFNKFFLSSGKSAAGLFCFLFNYNSGFSIWSYANFSFSRYTFLKLKPKRWAPVIGLISVVFEPSSFWGIDLINRFIWQALSLGSSLILILPIEFNKQIFTATFKPNWFKCFDKRVCLKSLSPLKLVAANKVLQVWVFSSFIKRRLIKNMSWGQPISNYSFKFCETYYSAHFAVRKFGRYKGCLYFSSVTKPSTLFYFIRVDWELLENILLIDTKAYRVLTSKATSKKTITLKYFLELYNSSMKASLQSPYVLKRAELFWFLLSVIRGVYIHLRKVKKNKINLFKIEHKDSKIEHKDSKIEHKDCLYVIKRGKRKGYMCLRPRVGDEYCGIHASCKGKKLNTCIAILTRGKRKGSMCLRQSVNDYCNHHKGLADR